MGSFVAVVPCSETAVEAEVLFQAASRALVGRRRSGPDSTISNAWSFAATCRRRNGTGASIVVDPETGSWLAVAGTPFHRSGSSEAEYLLAQYLKIGAERLAAELDGFFVIIAGNAATRQIVVITDVVGSLHVYHRQFGSGIALSTSSQVLAELDEVSLDAVGCQEFLGTGVIYEDRTFYSEVKKLPPATITTFANGLRTGQQQYWNVAGLTPELLNAEQATDTLWKDLTSAVTRINKQFGSVVCDLTGGYDSRAVAAAFLQGQEKFATAVSGPPNSGDVIVSRGLAEMFGLPHVHHPPRTDPITLEDLEAALQLTDGECDLIEYVAVARTHHDLSQRYEISINGSFGEIARGYWWELLFPRIGERSKLDSHKLATRRYALGSCSALFQPQYRLDLAGQMQSVIDRTLSGLETYPNTFQMDVAYLRMRMQRWQGRIASSTDRIWPCLSPFMFRTVLETMLQTRFAVRERSLLVRLMLARYQPQLAAYPLEHGNPASPATWKTLPRFWPLVPYYAGKVVQRLERKILRKQPAQAPSSRLHLWEMDEMRALLQPAAMKSMAVLDREAVTTFLESSRQPGFSQDSAWCRLLTLEMALARTRVKG